DACKGRSNKIAIVQGAPTAAASAYTLKGVENVLSRNPQVKVVSNQAADWDAAKAKALTQTVLKQHPDLCGIVGFWDGMDIYTALVPLTKDNAAKDGSCWKLTAK